MALNRLEICYLNSADHHGLKVKLEYIVDHMGADTFSEAFMSGDESISFFTIEGTEVFLFRKRIVIAEIYTLQDDLEGLENGPEALPA